MRSTEVVVAGAGVIGASCAYYLARSGVKVVLVDRGRPATGASGASAGGVRQQDRDPRELALAMRSVRLWTGLEAELGSDVRYRRSGHITLAETDEEVDALRARVAGQQAAGLDIVMLDAKELRDVAPGLSTAVLAGAFCPTDGHAHPRLTTEALAKGAHRSGATLAFDTGIAGIAVEHGRIVGVETTRGKIACDRVVNAAGAWGGRLAAMIGVELPITARALQMARTEPAPRALGPVLGSLHRPLSLKQTPDGSFLIGGGRPGRAKLERFAASTTRAEAVKGRADAVAVLPAVARAPLQTWWAGLEAFTPDGVPVIGALIGPSGMTVAVGFSGHGFALAPAVGSAVERLLAGAAPSTDVAPFAAQRFLSAVGPAQR